MNDKITEIKEEHERIEKILKEFPEWVEHSNHGHITYLLQLVETQHRYLERISVTFGEFECQRLAKEAMDKVRPI